MSTFLPVYILDIGAATYFGYNLRVPETAISSTRYVALLKETEAVIDTATDVGAERRGRRGD